MSYTWHFWNLVCDTLGMMTLSTPIGFVGLCICMIGLSERWNSDSKNWTHLLWLTIPSAAAGIGILLIGTFFRKSRLVMGVQATEVTYALFLMQLLTSIICVCLFSKQRVFLTGYFFLWTWADFCADFNVYMALSDNCL